jgi:outer membrane protein assembly factor BamB
MKIPLFVTILLLASPAATAANDWPQAQFDETHQASVPASQNNEFQPFLERWWNNKSLPGPTGSPAVRQGIVYIGDAKGVLHAIDQENGDTIWSQGTGTNTKISSTPAVGSDVVYVVNTNGAIYAFDRKTGVPSWTTPIQAGATDGSLMFHEFERILYLANRAGQVQAYFADTQSVKWTFTTIGTFYNTTCAAGSVEGTPVLFESKIFFGSTNKCFFAIDKTAVGTVTSPVWVFQATDSIRSSPAIDKTNRRVLVGDLSGRIYSLGVDSSGKVSAASWTYVEPLTGGVSSEFKGSPAIISGKAIVGARNGNVVAIDLSTGAKSWERKLGGEVVGSSAAANGHVMVGSQDRTMYMLKVADGTIADQRTALAQISTSAAISGTQAIWTSIDGTLHSFGGAKPARANLAVQGVSLSSTYVSQAGSISATIRNTGVLAAPQTTATIQVNGQVLSEVDIPALEPGQSKGISASYTPSATGKITVKVTVDPARVIQESDESDNVVSRDYTITNAPPPQTDTGGGGDTGKAPGFELWVIMAALGVAVLVRRRR